MTNPLQRQGRSRAATLARHRLFVEAYLTNGRNATRAYIAAGYSPATAQQGACKLMKDAHVIQLLEKRDNQILKIAGLSTERTLLEIARIAYFDPANLYRPDGTLKTIPEMDADTRAAISSVDVSSIVAKGKRKAKGGEAEAGPPDMHTSVKLHDKNAALDKAMRHQGLYEKDNSQRGESLQLQIVLVDPGGARSAPTVIDYDASDLV